MSFSDLSIRRLNPATVTARLIAAVLPARCLACGTIVDEQGGLCSGCWSDVRFVSGSVCRHCGLPMGAVVAEDPLCERCADEPPIYETARAALRYEGTGRRLILAFKHGDRIEGARTFAGWMLLAAREMLAREPLLVPVPLHRWRLVGRGFNQAALLARHLERLSAVRCLPDALRRRHGTASQQGLSAAARRENVTAAAFDLSPAGARAIDGRAVVLVDDVLTTGATVGACAAVLKQAGASRVDVLTLARVA